MFPARFALAFSGLALVAGCVVATDEPDMTMTETVDLAAGGPPFITTMDASVSNAAVDACRASLEGRTQGGVTVVGSEFSQANTAIYMRVGANGAPWRCLVSNDGSNPSLMSMTDEGAL